MHGYTAGQILRGQAYPTKIDAPIAQLTEYCHSNLCSLALLGRRSVKVPSLLSDICNFHLSNKPISFILYPLKNIASVS